MKRIAAAIAVLSFLAGPAYASNDKGAEARRQIEATVTAYPKAESVNGGQAVSSGSATVVSVSNYQGNLIRCGDALGAWRFDADKGLDEKSVVQSGNDLTLSFKALRGADGENLYAEKPVAGWVECGGEKYRLILLPSYIPFQTVSLVSSGPKRSDKAAARDGQAKAETHTAAVCNLIGKAWRGDYGETLEVADTKSPRDLRLFKNVQVRHLRTVSAPSIGYRLDEYLLILNPGAETIPISERVARELDTGGDVAGVALERHRLEIRDDCPQCSTSRLFIVKKAGGS